RYRTPFGIRHVTIDPDHGLTVNGEYTKLQGVDLHHDLGALGAAFHADAALRQLTIMKSMGVNALRTSHNPPAPEMIEICERLGIVMLVEAFDCWRTGKNPYDYGRFFDEHSEADITEMVRAARNSPAVIMWSIGNEIPDSTSTAGLGMAERLIDAVKKADDTRPVVIGSDKYRSLPSPGSAADQMLAKLDGLGLNYNTAASVDALHARYPHLFLFESESSSETSSRGAYQEPEHLNTGENHTPGKREPSAYDNNLASWTMSGEYGLKKDRDRKFFTGQFLWSGIDYIGEPTPYDVFPVKASFFGAVDTAGFPKDMYYLFKSQWTSEPMVHLVPMDWTGHRPGETVEVWVYANVDTVELFLNGHSLGVRRFDTKKTTDGRTYLETTEATGDDKTVTTGPYPGSYTSPNNSAGKL
ncbi:glycoside hydrolase family 2 TIM barrel-domain containing protein, partial [Streptomyces sp. NPDC021098]